jgi:hypothetical protein
MIEASRTVIRMIEAGRTVIQMIEERSVGYSHDTRVKNIGSATFLMKIATFH